MMSTYSTYRQRNKKIHLSKTVHFSSKSACIRAEKGTNNRLEDNCGCYSSTSTRTTVTSMNNHNNISRAKYTLSKLKEESNILSQDQMGFTPLVSTIPIYDVHHNHFNYKIYYLLLENKL